MLDLRLPDDNRHRGETSSNIINPIVIAERPQALCHRFEKTPCGHLDGVLDPFQVTTRHPASPNAHERRNITFRLLFAMDRQIAYRLSWA